MKRMLFAIIFISSFIFISYNDASADNKRFTNISIGRNVVRVLLPFGFINGLERFPQIRATFEHLLTDKNSKLLAAFITEEDVGSLLARQAPTFNRLIRVEVPKQWENINFRIQDFMEVKRIVNRDNFIQTILSDEQINNLVKEKDTWLKQAHNGFGVEFSTMIPIGIFYQDDNSIGYAIFSKTNMKLPGQEIKPIVEVRSMCFVLRANKCFSLFISSTFNSKEDIDWVYSTSKRIMMSR